MLYVFLNVTIVYVCLLLKFIRVVIYFSIKNSNVTYYILLLIDENFMYFIEQNYDLWLAIHLKACHFSCTGGFIILDITTSSPPPAPKWL